MAKTPLPALSLAAVPKRRRWTIELAREIERRGFAGIYCASFGDGMALCEAIALTTETIPFGTSIAPIYTRSVSDFAQMASFIHEVSGGRFRFGVGVSHAPMLARLGIEAGKPLADARKFVADFLAVPRAGELPPIVLATLRKRMVGLAGEIADGIVFANASRSHVPESLAALPEAKRDAADFFIGDMLPTCVSDDLAAARAVNRRTLSGYVVLPNYRNYWKEAGYVEEMQAVEKALAAGEREGVARAITDRFVDDATLAGPVSRVREGLEAWYDAGVRTPIVVPSSAQGNQIKAFEEIFAAFA